MQSCEYSCFITSLNTTVSRHSLDGEGILECYAMKCTCNTENVEIAGANERELWERYVTLISKIIMQ